MSCATTLGGGEVSSVLPLVLGCKTLVLKLTSADSDEVYGSLALISTRPVSQLI